MVFSTSNTPLLLVTKKITSQEVNHLLDHNVNTVDLLMRYRVKLLYVPLNWVQYLPTGSARSEGIAHQFL